MTENVSYVYINAALFYKELFDVIYAWPQPFKITQISWDVSFVEFTHSSWAQSLREKQEYTGWMSPWSITSQHRDLMTFWDHVWLSRLQTSTPQRSSWRFHRINCPLWDDTFWLIIFMIGWMLPHGAFVKFVQAESCVRQKDVSEFLIQRKCNSREWCAETWKLEILSWPWKIITILGKDPV